jgi:protein required for attachment to host cells
LLDHRVMRTCIAVVDASHARLFVHTWTVDGERVRDELAETADLVEPGRRLHEVDRFSSAHPGENRYGTRRIGYDDHRDANIHHEDAAFAARVIERISQLAAEATCDRVVVCAGPHMLGLLREHAAPLRQFAIDELPRDLAQLSGPELRDQLATYGVLPARDAPRAP